SEAVCSSSGSRCTSSPGSTTARSAPAAPASTTPTTWAGTDAAQRPTGPARSHPPRLTRPASPRPEGVPMNTILLAYVPSATSEAALAYAVDEAKRRDASLLVLASERAPDPRKARGVADRRPLEERLAETGLEFELRTVPKRDDPADDILDAIEHDDVLMVVLGIRRRTPIGKILLGSTSQRVAIESPVPVV